LDEIKNSGNVKYDSEIKAMKEQYLSALREIDQTKKSRDNYKKELESSVIKYNELMNNLSNKSHTSDFYRSPGSNKKANWVWMDIIEPIILHRIYQYTLNIYL